MVRNNINLFSNDGNIFKYVVEHIEDGHNRMFYKADGDEIIISASENVSSLKGNTLITNKLDAEIEFNNDIIRVYLPEYKPEYFDNKIKYLVECYIEYDLKKIILHSGVHTCHEALANDKIFRSCGVTYYEYIDFDIPSIKDILWGDDPESIDIRKSCEGEITEYNIPSTVLNVIITPLQETDEIHQDINLGTTALLVTNGKNAYMTARIGSNTDYAFDVPRFMVTWKFNDKYESIKEYIYETYFLREFDIRYILSVENKDNIWVNKRVQFGYDEFTDIQWFDHSLIKFDGWDNYEDGVMVLGEAQIVLPGTEIDDDDNIIMTVGLEPLELTQDVYKYFVGNLIVNNINLSRQDMNSYTFNTVNKVVKNVIQLDRPKDYKANIIKPVFYKVKDSANVIINPQVTENVCINLDSYKSMTEVFYLQIEGIIFNEIGRTAAGIIFKVTGHKLPGSVPAGTYYILDSRKEMITSGKYTYNA